MSRFLDPKYNGIAPYTPGEQPRAGGRVIKLNTNENPYPPAPGVVPAAAAAAGKLQLYSDLTGGETLDLMAKRLGVGREQVMLSNGSDEVLAFCFQALCPGGAAFADLTYGFYPVYCALYGVAPHIVPLEEDFTLDPRAYMDCRRTLFIANPNAPTGLALDRGQIEDLLRWNRGSLVVVDEAYVDFGAETAVPLLEEFDNLLVVGTFSKARNLAGARLGYVAGSAELIADLSRIRFSFNPYNVNSMTLAAGKAALEDEAYFEDCRRKVMATRARSLGAMRDLGFACTKSVANFLFAAHPKVPAEVLQRRLYAAGIFVRWFNVPRIQNHLRITVGTEHEMERLFEEIRKILENPEG